MEILLLGSSVILSGWLIASLGFAGAICGGILCIKQQRR